MGYYFVLYKFVIMSTKGYNKTTTDTNTGTYVLVGLVVLIVLLGAIKIIFF